MAALSSRTGIAPDVLADLDIETYNALAEESRDRWGHLEELVLANCYLLDRLTHVVASGISPKAVRALKPFKYLRPGEKPRNVVRPGELARRILGKG